MSGPVKPPTSFLEELRIEALEAVKPRSLILYGVAIIVFSGVSLILTYEFQVYASIIAGMMVALLLFASLVARRGFTKLDMVFVAGIIFLVIALFQRSFSHLCFRRATS